MADARARDGVRSGLIARAGLDRPEAHAELFDRLARIATLATGAPYAAVSLVGDGRQRFVGAATLEGEWPLERQTPERQSLCRTVVAQEATLALPDTANDERFADHPSVTELHVGAYLGVPIRLQTGEVLGSFCLFAHEPRPWTAGDVAIAEELAASAATEITLRVARRSATAGVVDALITGLRHEVNNALTGMSMEAELLAMRLPEGTEEHRSARVITEQALRVSAALKRLDDVGALVPVPTPEGGHALDFRAPNTTKPPPTPPTEATEPA
jgi:GAF domain-containing protein